MTDNGDEVVPGDGGDDAKHFRLNIRNYNNAMSFSSQGAKYDRELASNIAGPGAWSYRIQGATYHLITRGLLPDQSAREGSNASFAEIYIYDPTAQVERRAGLFNGARPRILQKLQEMLQESNKFLQDFRNHFESVEELEMASTQDFRLALEARRPTDSRQYDAATSDEVAAILPGDGEDSSGVRSIQLRKRRRVNAQGGALLQNVNQLHGEYDPLRYPLLLPCATAGWDANNVTVASVNGDGDVVLAEGNVSTCDWYRFHTMVRPNDFDALKLGGRLSQEYFVDQAAKLEEFRLNYIRQNQKLFRVWDAQGLQDQLQSDNYRSSGTSVILPASFTGGPRFMKTLYQDAMAVVRAMGRPTYFITMTCNPAWPEIERELLPGQLPNDRPDLVARVFRLKMTALLDDVTKKHVLGKCIAHTFSVEYQKRGLPHMHLLLIMHPDAKPRDSEALDQIVSAELPSQQHEPELFRIVTKMMLHGPCGRRFPKAPCMEGEGSDRACSKGFPKDFQQRTVLQSERMPIYRRREGGHEFHKGNFVYDSRWVVPYNKWLSKKYDCHVNVEYVTTYGAVKYMFKYVFKGKDRTTASIQKDETVKYVDARFIGASEAVWRLLKFRTHGQFPPVQALAIHLENMQRIWVPEVEGEPVAVDWNRAANTRTTLTEWLRFNNEEAENVPDEFRNVLYSDFPRFFTWNANAKRWSLRKNNTSSIGRIHFVSPVDVERYHLRILLHHVRGARCWEDLRSVDGHVYPTFKRACQARGLLRDDNEYDNVLREASSHLIGDALLDLFVIMILTKSVSDVPAFLERHVEALSDHIRRERPNASENAWRNTLSIAIQERLRASGESFETYFPSLPRPEEDPYLASVQHLLDIWDSDEMREAARIQVDQLNRGQRAAYDTIVESVANRVPWNHQARLFFLDGPGGSGKTFLYRALLGHLRGQRKLCIAVASSGIAALLLPGGSTAHSKFKIPLNCKTTLTCGIAHDSALAREIRSTKLIIFDEAPMMSKDVFHALDRTLRSIMADSMAGLGNIPFGGIPIVLGGDFRQILPVVPKGGRGQTVSATLNQSDRLWPHVVRLQLHTNERLDNDVDASWAQFLLDIGNGVAGDNITLPDAVQLCRDLQGLIQHVFGASIDESLPTDRAIICPKLDQVAEVNEMVISRLDTESKTYFSADTVLDDDGMATELYSTEFLNTLCLSGMPAHQLTLKVGAIVICLRNLDKRNGVCNGTRLRLTRLHERYVEGTIVTQGSFFGRHCAIPRVPITPSDTGLPFSFRRDQLPLSLAFAITINKSQGQSFGRIGIYAPTLLFTHGQLYVMLSRSRSGPQGIAVLSRTINNVVYKEVLRA